MSRVAIPAAPVQGFTPSPRLAAQLAELRDLEVRYPPPSVPEVMTDWAWVRERMEDGSFEPDGPFWEKHVAVCRGAVVGAGPDPLDLRLAKARDLAVHPDRLVITYIGDV